MFDLNSTPVEGDESKKYYLRHSAYNKSYSISQTQRLGRYNKTSTEAEQWSCRNDNNE